MYTRINLENACKFFLTEKVFDALYSANIGLPRIHEMAIRKAFIVEINDTNAEILRHCYIYLEKHGMYEFYNECENV